MFVAVFVSRDRGRGSARGGCACAIAPQPQAATGLKRARGCCRGSWRCGGRCAVRATRARAPTRARRRARSRTRTRSVAAKHVTEDQDEEEERAHRLVRSAILAFASSRAIETRLFVTTLHPTTRLMPRSPLLRARSRVERLGTVGGRNATRSTPIVTALRRRRASGGSCDLGPASTWGTAARLMWTTVRVGEGGGLRLHDREDRRQWYG